MLHVMCRESGPCPPRESKEHGDSSADIPKSEKKIQIQCQWHFITDQGPRTKDQGPRMTKQLGLTLLLHGARTGDFSSDDFKSTFTFELSISSVLAVVVGHGRGESPLSLFASDHKPFSSWMFE